MIEDGRQQVSNGELVEVLRILVLVECVVKLEARVLDVLRDAVHLQLRLVHDDEWVAC